MSVRNRRAFAPGPAAIAMLAILAAVTPARAQRREPAVVPPLRASAAVEPGIVKLGQRVVYRGRVISYHDDFNFKWLPPESDPDVTWGRLSARRLPGQPARGNASQAAPGRAPDTVLVEARIQAFRTGVVTIPGLRFQRQDPKRTTIFRLPSVRLIVTPVVTAADSNTDLRPVRGPIGAPWWERVPWMIVALVLLLVGAVVGLIVWMKRRRPVAAPVAAPSADPASEALAELKALRALNLPALGRFAEHAFRLSRILRRFLEATVNTPRPGDTSGELIAHLESTPMDREDLERLKGLLGIWDRVKFARAAWSVEEAARSELAVETIVKRVLRPASPSIEKVA